MDHDEQIEHLSKLIKKHTYKRGFLKFKKKIDYGNLTGLYLKLSELYKLKKKYNEECDALEMASICDMRNGRYFNPEISLRLVECLRNLRVYDKADVIMTELIKYYNEEDDIKTALEHIFDIISYQHENTDVEKLLDTYQTIYKEYNNYLTAEQISSIASVYINNGNIADAIELYKVCLEKDDVEPVHLINLILCYLCGDNIVEAKNLYNKYPKHINNFTSHHSTFCDDIISAYRDKDLTMYSLSLDEYRQHDIIDGTFQILLLLVRAYITEYI